MVTGQTTFVSESSVVKSNVKSYAPDDIDDENIEQAQFDPDSCNYAQKQL